MRSIQDVLKMSFYQIIRLEEQIAAFILFNKTLSKEPWRISLSPSFWIQRTPPELTMNLPSPQLWPWIGYQGRAWNSAHFCILIFIFTERKKSIYPFSIFYTWIMLFESFCFRELDVKTNSVDRRIFSRSTKWYIPQVYQKLFYQIIQVNQDYSHIT